MLPVLVLYYSRSYASVYDTKENAHMLYWTSVDHVQTYRPEARTQGKHENDFSTKWPVFCKMISVQNGQCSAK